MPPIQSVLYRVNFYYVGSETTPQYWQAEGKFWSKNIDHFAQPSSELRAAVARIVAPSDTDLAKAEKIYAAVQALDNTDFSDAKSQSEMNQLKLKPPKRAEDVWTQKSGTSEQIALLYLAMLRAAGLQAYAMTVADRTQNLFDYSYLNMDQFNATLVLVGVGGDEIPTDPGEKMCPFGTLAWAHTNTVGMSQSSQGVAFGKVPSVPYAQNTTIRSGEIDFVNSAGVTGQFSIVMNGQQALYWRQAALRNDPVELKKQFDQGLAQIVPAGIDAHVDHFIGMDDSNANLIAIVKVKGAMGAAMADRLLLPAFFFESRVPEPFVAEKKRIEPVDMHFPERVIDQVTYDLPPGFRVEGAPPGANISWPQHAVYAVQSTSAPGKITIERDLFRNFDMLQASDYQQLRGFYQKVASDDQQEIVLHGAPETKGN